MTREQFFAALRRAVPGIWNKPGAIAEGNELFDALGTSAKPDAPTEPERNSTPTKIGTDGIALIKLFEGCHKKLPDGRIGVYPDPGTNGVPYTVGWGSTRGLDNKPFQMGQTFTQAQVDALLERDLKKYADAVAKALGPALARTSQAQFDALVSFHYNTGAIDRATLTAKHRAGLYAEAAMEFARWNRAGGRVLAGLTRRRKAEAELYRSGS